MCGPPKWACGGWVNRALELPNVRHVSVWGCGNFECWWPHQIFGNRRAERAGILEVHPWADDRPLKDRQRKGAILRDNWRERFEEFAKRLASENVYVTIDLDCLRIEEAVTNWESGRFTVADLEWALGKLRESSRIIGGDICGAYSPPHYARWKQRFAAEFDRPKLVPPDSEKARATNLATLEKLWPLLQAQNHWRGELTASLASRSSALHCWAANSAHRNEHDPGSDQERTDGEPRA